MKTTVRFMFRGWTLTPKIDGDGWYVMSGATVLSGPFKFARDADYSCAAIAQARGEGVAQ